MYGVREAAMVERAHRAGAFVADRAEQRRLLVASDCARRRDCTRILNTSKCYKKGTERRDDAGVCCRLRILRSPTRKKLGHRSFGRRCQSRAGASTSQLHVERRHLQVAPHNIPFVSAMLMYGLYWVWICCCTSKIHNRKSENAALPYDSPHVTEK